MKRTHPADQLKDLDDNTLTRKLGSEALTRTAVPESIKVNVEDGVVVLRGEVDSPDRMSELAETVMEVPGVTGVENLLHLPGEPAPNKAAALEYYGRFVEVWRDADPDMQPLVKDIRQRLTALSPDVSNP